jgi:hypothetical protein
MMEWKLPPYILDGLRVEAASNSCNYNLGRMKQVSAPDTLTGMEIVLCVSQTLCIARFPSYAFENGLEFKFKGKVIDAHAMRQTMWV